MTLTAERPATSAAARRAMIESQLRPSGVNEPWILAAMEALPREGFLPAEAHGHAYMDRAIPLGDGRFLAAPLVHGRMLGEAAPTAQDKVLVVSTTGYLAALVKGVTGSVDLVDPAEAAAKKKGDYALLLIDGAIEQLPAALAARLAEGGRIVTGLVERGVTRLAAGRKLGGEVSLLALAEIGIPVLPEFAAPKRWSF